jgi:chromosome segregation ATPase
MSQLGKMLLYVALAGAVVAAIMGGLIVKKRIDDAALLLKTQALEAGAEAKAKKSAAEAADLTQKNTDLGTQLSTANTQVTELTDKLTTAQKTASDAAVALAAANDAQKKAQDQLDAINKTLNGKTAGEIVAAEAKAESDLKDAQGEQKIIQDSLEDSKKQIADLTSAINRSKTGTMPGVSGKITFVDNAWNFVILDVGLAAGVVPNGELIVYRGRTFLGKVRVTKVDPNDSVAEILPDVKGQIQIGDAVLN